ncbi:unnamed protein product [Alopecurus aequalis]
MPRPSTKRKKPSFDEKQDATQMVCGRCGGSAQVARSKLSYQVSSKLSASLVSVASFNGNKVLHECTGIFIKSLNANTPSVLTSFSLVAYDDGSIEKKRRDVSRIEVKLPNGQVVHGKLAHSHNYYDIAIVGIDNLPPGFRPEYLSLDHGVQFEPHIEVVAAWRSHHTGEFKTTRGTLDDIPEINWPFWSSTCIINTAGVGGALIDSDGNFIGMNFHGKVTKGLTYCVPLHTILEWLRYFGMLPDTEPEQEGGYGTRKSSTSETQIYSTSYLQLPEHMGGAVFIDDLCEWATSWGYPLPDPRKICDGMYLNYTFEEEFGEDISSILSKRVALKVSQSVVSLASFNGKTRVFACTGVFIGCGAHSAKILTSASLVRDSGDDVQKTNHNMRIEVRLPNNRRVKGILKYCNLGYNIAIVDIVESRRPHGIKLEGHKPVNNGTDIVAVGCLSQDHKLMATKGSLIDKNTDWQHQHSCEELSFSSCKITKAGIGGPLIDMCGNIVGMNFYHEECTLFLSSSIILDLLKDDFSKDICAQCLRDGPVAIGGKNRWPVTQPCWVYPPLSRLKKALSITTHAGSYAHAT